MMLLVEDNLRQVMNSGKALFDFLLPTGVLVLLEVDFYASLDQIKTALWREAEKYPLYSKLKLPTFYYFSCVNKDSVPEELIDESQSLYDVCPMCPFLRLVEKGDNQKYRSLKRQIVSLIGKALHGLDDLPNTEVADFRHSMGQYCQDIVRQRNWQGRENKLLYLYPPSLRNTAKLPDHLQDRLFKNAFVIVVRYECAQMSNFSTTVQVPGESYPHELISFVFKKIASKTGYVEENEDDFILKVCGQEEFIYGGNKHYNLLQFKYMYQCLVRNNTPDLILLHKDKVLGKDLKPPIPPRRQLSLAALNAFPLTNSSTYTMPKEVCTSWNVKQKVQITVYRVSNVNLPDSKIRLEAGLFQGSESLCLARADALLTDGQAIFDKTFTFDLDVEDLPQSTRLCLAVCKLTQKSRKTVDVLPVAWANTPMFDWRSRLQRGEKVFYMWPVTDDMMFVETVLHPIGNVAPNPQGNKGTTLSVKFSDYEIKGTIVYPTFDKEEADENGEEVTESSLPQNSSFVPYLAELRTVLEQDPLSPLCEQDKDLVWMQRYEVKNRFPHGLPKLLASMKWTNHNDVEEVQGMLKKWPKLSPERALELLDFAYPDRNVRDFAVSCLDQSLTDEDLSQYMLQLVQALKYESYLCCPLVEFLLTRAIYNQRIGHQLFWLLKAETETPCAAVQFGLILEIYCQASEDHMKSLIKQSEALHKLKSVNELVKNEKFSSGEKRVATARMQEVLNQSSYKEALGDILCPLTPRLKLKSIVVEKCKFMDSKKRPLWLVWKNGDPYGEDIYMLYKNGDDLRQDMLTLQIIQIMDSIWQAEGLDLRMNPYGCLATGRETGMIEVVRNSQTIANIVKLYDKTTFNKTSLYNWIKNHNSVDKLEQAVEEFTLSCAGYCVATYVLGVGDRHSDNIMLKESGQLFHIDFGHFLGNFKMKFGVKRERVPFVLTNHFVHVITKGGQEQNCFQRFRDYCEQAYLILRRKNHLMITLFMLMLSTGIPELTCVQDIDYIREALAINMTEAQAIKHFREKFNEALRNSWKTSVNWMIHGKAKNNA